MNMNKNFRMDPRQENFIAVFAITILLLIFAVCG